VPLCSNCGKEVYDRRYCHHCGQLVTIYHNPRAGYRSLKVLVVLSVISAIFWFILIFFQIVYLSYNNVSVSPSDILTGLFVILANCCIYFFSFLSYRYVSPGKIRNFSFIAWSLFVLCNLPFVIFLVILS